MGLSDAKIKINKETENKRKTEEAKRERERERERDRERDRDRQTDRQTKRDRERERQRQREREIENESIQAVMTDKHKRPYLLLLMNLSSCNNLVFNPSFTVLKEEKKDE